MDLRLYFKINSVVMLGRDEAGISDGSDLEFLVSLGKNQQIENTSKLSRPGPIGV